MSVKKILLLPKDATTGEKAMSIPNIYMAPQTAVRPI
jgi:hypothetical protein